MNMNERLRKKMEKRGPKDAEEFGAEYRENARNFNTSDYEEAKEQVRKYRKNIENVSRTVKV